ncbi:MAG TPA: type II toxin-antitoxin system VapC family toxin [Blastocatellia bacterium]|nr:type II toxin-antitoxin system VapC family toxin [Blastocatellia bacterium]HMV86279.1 type II toxin-antitoxin system VapC family toxin [Blastocatellia bacterium]HMX30269.1 type II toxin-antitoxin system VapC family toxin [Blastocatellia bacterium]HMY75098.1 type II toxin-antitoxin system VapC family toxin [Blastocatellia bacterium]HMZ18521.1 type II toxin-antitoxin system VapC family toxin [Blastocatellia bacterium]
MYILDTDHISQLESLSTSPEAQRLRFRLAGLKPEEWITTIITFEEQVRGWMAYLAKARLPEQQVKAYSRLKGVLNHYLKITVLEFDEAVAAEFERLKQARVRIGTMDLRIAAIALTHNATVLTRNIVDFGQVPDLRVEDWRV